MFSLLYPGPNGGGGIVKKTYYMKMGVGYSKENIYYMRVGLAEIAWMPTEPGLDPEGIWGDAYYTPPLSPQPMAGLTQIWWGFGAMPIIPKPHHPSPLMG